MHDVDGRPDHQISQFDLQTYLWLLLPRLIRDPEGLADWPQLVEDAAANFDRVGKPRYAAICRSEQTAEILSAAHDEPRCRELYEQAMRESGLYPPEGLRITWIADPGPYEQALFDAIPRALEQAIAEGILDPADEAHRLRVAAAVLDLPPDGHTESVHDLMLVERLELWGKRCGSQTLRELLVRAGPELAEPLDLTPEVLLAGAAPLGRLLHSCGEEGLARDDWPESDLRYGAIRFGLLEAAGGRLRRTEAGDRVLDHPFLIFDAVCTGLLNGNDRITRHALAPLFTMLVLADTVDFDMLAERVGMVLDETGWRDAAHDEPVPEHNVRDMVLDLLTDLHDAGGTTDEDDERLTPFGRQIVLACVRQRVMQGGIVA